MSWIIKEEGLGGRKSRYLESVQTWRWTEVNEKAYQFSKYEDADSVKQKPLEIKSNGGNLIIVDVTDQDACGISWLRILLDRRAHFRPLALYRKEGLTTVYREVKEKATTRTRNSRLWVRACLLGTLLDGRAWFSGIMGRINYLHSEGEYYFSQPKVYPPMLHPRKANKTPKA